MAPGGNGGGAMKGTRQPSSEFRAGDGSDMNLAYDYRVFFTDAACKKYFPKVWEELAKGEDRVGSDNGMVTIATIYATLVYYIYPASQEFKNAIEGNSELRSNFEMMRKWVEENGYRQLADRFVAEVADATILGG